MDSRHLLEGRGGTVRGVVAALELVFEICMMERGWEIEIQSCGQESCRSSKL
jgi:hypothetical protein